MKYEVRFTTQFKDEIESTVLLSKKGLCFYIR